MADPPVEQAGRAAPDRSEIVGVAALAALAVAVRTVIWLRAAAMMNDGPTFLLLARRLARGDWQEALAHPYHPLYPLTIALANPLVPGGLESAAVAVSIASGALAVVCLYGFLRSAFDRRTAAIGGLLLAVHPYAAPYSADVQSEGLYIALFLAAVAATWRALNVPGLAAALPAGLLAGLAYLTRPEGIGVALAGGVVMLGLWLRRQRSLRVAALFGLGVALGSGAVVAPYTALVETQTGEVRLTRKKSVRAIVSLERGASGAPAEATRPATNPASGLVDRARALGAAVPVVAEVAKRGFRLDHFVIGALGAATLGLSLGLRGAFLAVLVGVYALVLLGLQAFVGYVSIRHALPPLLPLLGYVSLGVPVLGRVVLWLPRQLARRPAPGARVALAVGLAILLTASTVMATRPQRRERAATREAAAWLRENAQPRRVAAAKKRDAYYAGARHVRLPPPQGERGDWIDALRHWGVRFAIIDEGRSTRYPGLGEVPDPRVRVLHRSQAAGRSAAVVEIRGDE